LSGNGQWLCPLWGIAYCVLRISFFNTQYAIRYSD
jgi:hypothetical protein